MVVVAHPHSSPTPHTAPAPSARAGIHPVPTAQLPPLSAYLAQVPDPHSARGRRYPLPALLALLCLAMLSGIHGYLPAAEWGWALDVETKTALGFTHPKSSVASTFYAVLEVLPWETLVKQLRAWATVGFAACREAGGEPGTLAAPEADPDALAIDGKAMRGSWKRRRRSHLR